MDDTRIIELFWARSEAAITEISAKYGAYCRSIADNILSNREDAEECVNDTWLRVWSTIPPERPVVLRAWLGRIVRNLALNRWQKNHAQKRGSGVDEILTELEGCIPSAQDVERQVEAEELSRLINLWLGTLQKRDRMVFVRRYWYGESVQTLAKTCAVSPAKMAKKLFVLRGGLKQALEKEDIFS